MANMTELKLFATKPHACSYLDEETATTLFVDPDAEMDGPLFSQLSDMGFRRSGPHVYRPRCASCRACIPIRIPVESFRANRSQRRCIKKNYDLEIAPLASIDSDECFELYAHYIQARHADGDMFPPSRQQYQEFLTREWDLTEFFAFRESGRLVAVSVADRLERGLSAVYSFFDPTLDARGLGKFNILFLIEESQRRRLPYVYLGYWIKQCQKMGYKVAYRPFQVLIDGVWMTVSDFSKDTPED